ncbi:hypothetical protein MYX84_09610 [Acidobacteria bacterium AH-259-O06]|nr:hypothetical protein [Acidobacteria bacterium AH-259-O06]
MGLLIGFGLWSLISWVVLGWNGLPLRFWISRIFLLAGLVSIGVAPFVNGVYSQPVILFIGGPNPYQVEDIQRSFTSLSLGIGIALLSLWVLTCWGHRLPWKSPLGQAVKFSIAIIILRVYFEKLGVLPNIAMLIGIIWLILPLSIYFALEAAKGGSQRRFWTWLLSYAFAIRILILALMVLATYFHLGTHFDNSSITTYTVFGKVEKVEAGSWDQYRNLIVFPQMVLWPAVTLTVGVIIGWPTYLISSRRQRAEP